MHWHRTRSNSRLDRSVDDVPYDKMVAAITRIVIKNRGNGRARQAGVHQADSLYERRMRLRPNADSPLNF